MRIAVLGVGLIGGSIGMAARARLEARVAGWDPERANLERALELGALDEAAGSVAAAAGGADVVFCAAPVRALPQLVREALGAGGEAVVSDVGSTKLGLVEAVAGEPGAERFIGGHPLAGAETAGVANARADLFADARWYLTPGPRSSGVHYDRLQRTLADLGARPQAIGAAEHDRLMATISHVPHALANVLVTRAREALANDGPAAGEVGPSFRDSARVAGANPAIWADIFASNAEAVAAGLERVRAGLGEAIELLRGGDADAIDAWHREALAARRELLDADASGGELHEIRVAVANRPGTVAEIALALGRAGVNIEDMGLYPAADMRSGAVSLWVAGAEQARRAVAVVRELGHAAAIVGGPQ